MICLDTADFETRTFPALGAGSMPARLTFTSITPP